MYPSLLDSSVEKNVGCKIKFEAWRLHVCLGLCILQVISKEGESVLSSKLCVGVLNSVKEYATSSSQYSKTIHINHPMLERPSARIEHSAPIN